MKVLMIGAGRDVRGGVSSVVNGYYEVGLDKKCELTYLPTMKDGSKLKKLLVAVWARIRFERLIRRCDILHVHMSADKSFYRKAIFIRRAYKEKKKIIIHMHGSTFDLFYRESCDDAQKKQVRDFFALADRVIALSEDWKAFLSENICDAGKIQVLYNAVKSPKPYDKDYGNRDMLFLGILGERKGVYDMIEILPEIFTRFPDAHLYLCGDGERESAERLCEEKGVSSHVTFLGWVRGAEKEKLLKQCSVYVLPSHHEGMPMSVLEAMSYGMAVVSTRIGGIPHLITDRENGLLHEPGDREALKNDLYVLLANESLREELGRRAAERIQKDFDMDKQADRLLELYKESMEAQP